MANVSPDVGYSASVYQIETNDPVLGGANGIANKQAKTLLGNDIYLKEHVDDLETLTTDQGNTLDVQGGKIDALEPKMVNAIETQFTPQIITMMGGGPLTEVTANFNGSVYFGSAANGFNFTTNSRTTFPESNNAGWAYKVGHFKLIIDAPTALMKQAGVKMKYLGPVAVGSLADGSTAELHFDTGDIVDVFLGDDTWIIVAYRHKT